MKTKSLLKAKEGSVKIVIAPNEEGYCDLEDVSLLGSTVNDIIQKFNSMMVDIKEELAQSKLHNQLLESSIDSLKLANGSLKYEILQVKKSVQDLSMEVTNL